MRLSNIVLLLVLAITAIIASVSAMQDDAPLVQGGQRGLISGEEKRMEENQQRRLLLRKNVWDNLRTGVVVSIQLIWAAIHVTTKLLGMLYQELSHRIALYYTKARSPKKTGTSKHGSHSKKEDSKTDSVKKEGSFKKDKAETGAEKTEGISKKEAEKTEGTSTLVAGKKDVESPSRRMLRSEGMRLASLKTGFVKLKELFERLVTFLKNWVKKMTQKSSTNEGSVKKTGSSKNGSASKKEEPKNEGSSKKAASEKGEGTPKKTETEEVSATKPMDNQ